MYDFGGLTIKHHSDNTVVKSGTKIRRESEAAALCFTAQIGLPTPRVHEVFEGKVNGVVRQTEIETDFIEGQTLESVWPTLLTQGKRDICLQLKPYNTYRKSSRDKPRTALT